MKMMTLHRILIFVTFVVVSTSGIFAEQITKGKVTITYDMLADGGIKVINVWNNEAKKIELKLDGKIITVLANSSAQPKQTAYNYVRYDFATGGGAILWKSTPKKESVVEDTPIESTEAVEISETQTNKKDKSAAKVVDQRRSQRSTKVSMGYAERIYQDSFFGTEAVNAYIQKVEEFCKGIDSSKNKSQYLIDNDIKQFLDNSEKEIIEKKSALPEIVQEIAHQSNVDGSQSSTINLITETLNGRLKTREDAYNKLNSLAQGVDDDKNIMPHDLSDNIINYGIVGAIIVLLIILTIVTIRKKRINTINQVKQLQNLSPPSVRLQMTRPLLCVVGLLRY